jgi:hypothetical protein
VEWVRTFQITVRWVNARHSHKGVARYQFATRSAATLAQTLRWARRNPHVTSCTYRVLWQLDGDRPTVCRRGHRYPTGSARNAARSETWLRCVCGGHHRLACPACGDVRVEPAPQHDCTIDTT